MTKAAKRFGKELKHFWDNQSTKDYMETLEKIGGIPPNIQKDATRGRSGVTYLHPKLAVFFARWLDVRFAVWCDMTTASKLASTIS